MSTLEIYSSTPTTPTATDHGDDINSNSFSSRAPTPFPECPAFIPLPSEPSPSLKKQLATTAPVLQPYWHNSTGVSVCLAESVDVIKDNLYISLGDLQLAQLKRYVERETHGINLNPPLLENQKLVESDINSHVIDDPIERIRIFYVCLFLVFQFSTLPNLLLFFFFLDTYVFCGL